MKFKIVNITVSIFVLGFIVPFVLQTDIFPFVRFGMFAEKPQILSQKELFLISYQTKDGKLHTIDYQFTKQSKWHQLALNYHLRKQEIIYLQKLNESFTEYNASKWFIDKVVIESNYQQDTVKLASYEVK